ncbi:BlaI/MecI/CopY family transcriptional regulator [Kinneretia aquatilis]|jgi:predicted transcriptional regulator|uniref:BlaI/MecI/CopY family transcriptional regulator n=1 Tax=Kinneretia aquatilis TaxID=2070761 RepID=UPI0014952611|nr:BlaI/MecI/CopY family transcriptional regulator [Paucibacter aquatile]WIV99391.1 BlaI/MecI/CopY family transcriptional regulator [Paucibacter aquatile]
MARPKSTELTPAEQRIMQVLWRGRAMTVREIAAELSTEHELAYTTVQTLCRILLDKGHVSCEKQGKAFVYQALTVQQEARSQALLGLLKKFFGGSPTLLAQHLLNQEALSPEVASQLQAQIDRAAAQAAAQDPSAATAAQPQLHAKRPRG